MEPLNQIICGDCVEVMANFPDESIECVVTDPPYGICFMGKEWDRALPPKQAFMQIFRVLKPGALAFIMSSPRQDVLWRMLKMLEECGFQLRQSFVSWVYKSGFPKAYDVSKGIDKKLGVKREIVGTKTIDVGMQKNQMHSGRPIKKVEVPNDVATSDLAKKWSGYKSITGLKPALECILMVNKPMSEKTIVDNVLKHGVGAINVDACRIPFQNEDIVDNNWWKKDKYESARKSTFQGKEHEVRYSPTQGRFPANLLVSDEALDTGKITKSGTLEAHHKITSSKTDLIYGSYKNQPPKEHSTYGDVGDQSRYFDLDAWSRHHGFLDVPKASKTERESGLAKLPMVKDGHIASETGGGGGWKKDEVKNPNLPRRNFHPTVKPVRLMAYLIELGCPEDGVVLDPFVGSGTTCIAAQTLGRNWIGIEINKEYVKIAKARINALPQTLPSFFAVNRS